MSQMLQMVQDQVEQDDADELGDIFSELGRPQDLFWKEDNEGRLLGGDSSARPELVVRVALDGGELTAEELDPSDVEWGRPFISEPETAIRDQQYD